MLQKNSNRLTFYIIFILFSMLFTSCSKLYWYRQKVKLDSRVKTPIHFHLINQSPAYLSVNFENTIKKYCLAALNKKGYIEAVKDSARFDFIIQLKVDSFPVKYQTWLDPIYDGMSYGTTIRELSFKYDLLFVNTDVHYWTNQSNFYYFSRETRDLKRSRSMINYVLKHIASN